MALLEPLILNSGGLAKKSSLQECKVSDCIHMHMVWFLGCLLSAFAVPEFADPSFEGSVVFERYFAHLFLILCGSLCDTTSDITKRKIASKILSNLKIL